MKRVSVLSLLLAMAVLPAGASAQASPVPDAEEYLNFLNGSGIGGLYGSPSEVGPYTGRFETPQSYSFSLYCVDYLHTAGDGWVMSTSLGTGQTDAGMGNTRRGATVGSLAAYRQAAYMASLFDNWTDYTGGGYTTNSGSTTVTTQRQVWSAIQVAIWNVMNPGVPGYAGNQGLSGYLSSAAAAAVSGGYLANGWYVLTPETGPGTGVVSSSRQEFIVRTNVVPEPSTYLLMITGLLFLVAFSRKRFLGRSDAA